MVTRCRFLSNIVTSTPLLVFTSSPRSSIVEFRRAYASLSPSTCGLRRNKCDQSRPVGPVRAVSDSGGDVEGVHFDAEKGRATSRFAGGIRRSLGVGSASSPRSRAGGVGCRPSRLHEPDGNELVLGIQ